MTALGGFILGSLLGRKSIPVVENTTNIIHKRPMTPTEIAEHEECLRRIKEHEPKVKVTLVASQDFIGMPMTKENMENMDRYYARKEEVEDF